MTTGYVFPTWYVYIDYTFYTLLSPSGKVIIGDNLVALVLYAIPVVHGSDGPAGRVGSGRVTILPDFGGSGRVGSGRSALRIFIFYGLFLGTCMNRYESSNTTFGLIDFSTIFLIYNN